MTKTKIEWADYTFNPITGCLRGCEYCYARGIARRFAKDERYTPVDNYTNKRVTISGKICEFGVVHNPLDEKRMSPYPYGFDPTFHRYRLGEPAKVKKPQTIFVGSMTDMFGGWVPDEWIKAVFEACEAAPWHRYLFLTKNSSRYTELWQKGIIQPRHDNIWLGSTRTAERDEYFFSIWCNTFISIEPIQERVCIKAATVNRFIDFVIVGAETGNRKGKVMPKREWIESIAEQCRDANVPLFMKNSLRGLMGEDFVQETAW